MHTFQMNSHINENGILSVTLPKEWAKQDVNVLLVVESLSQTEQSIITDSTQRKERLKNALANAVSLNIFADVDGVAWQNEQRQDRNIGYEE